MLLSLRQFQELTGWHPLHFFGLASNSVAPVTSSCVDLIRQHNWQNTDGIGRSELEQAITTAEQKIQRYLGFAPAERYTQVDATWPALGIDPNYRPLYLRSLALPDEGYVSGFGTEVLAAVELGAAIVYSAVASVGAGFDDTATITVATTETDATKLRLYVPDAERVPARTAAGEDWRINPIKATITGGTATLIIPSWLLVRPILYESFAINTPNGIDPADSASYLSTLDVYTSSASDNHGTAYYDGAPYPGWCCAVGDNAAVAYANIRSALVNPKYGIINPMVSVYNADTATWSSTPLAGQCRAPDRLLLNIRAGFPRQANGDMASEFATIVARLAMAEIQGRPCGCDSANHVWDHWQTDISRTSGADQFAFKEAALNNPFGPKRGHIEAWQAVLRLQHVRGVTIH
jgi:hypothetical protein